MHDGITFERRGVPAAVVITEPFAGAARAMAAFDGAPWFEWAMMPHPTADLRGDAIAAAAMRVVPVVEALLLGRRPLR